MKKQYTENDENLLLSKKCPGVSSDINPYNVCVMLMGHNQIVQNDHMLHDVASDRLLTVCSLNIRKQCKIPPTSLKL